LLISQGLQTFEFDGLVRIDLPRTDTWGSEYMGHYEDWMVPASLTLLSPAATSLGDEFFDPLPSRSVTGQLHPAGSKSEEQEPSPDF